MDNRPGAKRPYQPRACACGAEAIYAVQVMARTLGRGQSKANRKIKLGTAAILCGQCSRDVNTFIEALGRSGVGALDQVRRPRPIEGAPLFDQTEA